MSERANEGPLFILELKTILRPIHTIRHVSVPSWNVTVHENFSHVKLNGDVHSDKNFSVTSQYRFVAVAERECLT